MLRLAVFLMAFGASAAVGCDMPPARQAQQEREDDHAPARLVMPIVTSAEPVDDGKLHFFRSYFAVEEVGRLAHHYDAYYLDVEQSHCHIVVVDGKVAITGSDFGGLSRPPAAFPAVPSSQVDEVAAVETAVGARYPHATQVRVAFDGNYRRVVVSEMIVVTAATMMNKPVGWHGRAIMKSDEALTKLEGRASGFASSGYGMIDIPKGSARIDFALPASIDGQELLTTQPVLGPLAAPALVTARAVVAGRPVPSFDALLAAPHDTTLPETYDQPITLRISAFARHTKPGEQVARELALSFRPREGKTTASTETDLDGVHVKVTATMGPLAPTPEKGRKQLAQEGEDMEAMVDLHVEDNRGNTIDRSYRALGRVVVQGKAVAFPTGLELPGTSSPSPEAEALKFSWPGSGAARSIDVYVDPVMWAAPR